jgi:hypothetical protein
LENRKKFKGRSRGVRGREEVNLEKQAGLSLRAVRWGRELLRQLRQFREGETKIIRITRNSGMNFKCLNKLKNQ